MTKRITFVLPGASPMPAGGPRIVYEYANRLAERGHRISVVHAPVIRVDPDWRMWAKALIRYPQRLLDKSYRPDAWMAVHPSIRLSWVPTLHARYIPDGDVVIATAWNTAEWVARYGERKGTKYYLIQAYEDWDAPGSRVEATWRLPLKKIVIAKWLVAIAQDLGESAVLVPNAIDPSHFFCEVPPQSRNPRSVAMLYHDRPAKGGEDGLNALYAVMQAVPDLSVDLFGVSPRPAALPKWVTYHRNPPQPALRALYNRAAIYLASSRTEGWGLTGLEAMACGAALALTDINGFREFARHDVNALLSPPKDPAGLARNLIRLMEDDDLRLRLAKAGLHRVREFEWRASVDRFEAAVLGPAAVRAG